MIAHLINVGADLDQRYAKQRTALHIAATMPQVAAISPDGNSALHLATKEGFMANVRLLLDQGAKINVRNKAGLTPLGALSQSPDGDDGIQLFC